jgi:hypothetical protein
MSHPRPHARCCWRCLCGREHNSDPAPDPGARQPHAKHSVFVGWTSGSRADVFVGTWSFYILRKSCAVSGSAGGLAAGVFHNSLALPALAVSAPHCLQPRIPGCIAEQSKPRQRARELIVHVGPKQPHRAIVVSFRVGRQTTRRRLRRPSADSKRIHGTYRAVGPEVL